MGPRTGIKGFFQRTLLNQLVSKTLEGAEPLNTMPFGSAPIGEQLLSVVEDTGPLARSGPLATGAIDLANAPTCPGRLRAPSK